MTAPSAPKVVEQNCCPSRSIRTALATVKVGHFSRGSKKIWKEFFPDRFDKGISFGGDLDKPRKKQGIQPHLSLRNE
jgi:hypothetical protein